MSKLTKELDLVDDYPSQDIPTITTAKVRELLEAHDAGIACEAAAQARKEALEAVCEGFCRRCQWHIPMSGGMHIQDGERLPCYANDFRAEFKRRWPEEFSE